jgi:hypothetical protein
MSCSLFSPVNFSELTQQMIAFTISLRAKFVILPPNHDSPGACLAEILPSNIRVDIPDPLAGLDLIGAKVRYVSKKQLRTETILHDETYEKDSIG